MWTAIGLGVIVLTLVIAAVAALGHRSGSESGLRQRKGKRNDTMI